MKYKVSRFRFLDCNVIYYNKKRTRDTLYFIFIQFCILRVYTFQISINLSIYRRNMLLEHFINGKKLC
jgi:hypothetical protein